MIHIWTRQWSSLITKGIVRIWPKIKLIILRTDWRRWRMHGYCWYSRRIVILIPSMSLTLTYLRSCNGSNRGIPRGIGGGGVPTWSTCHHCLTSGWSRIIVALVATCLQSNNRNWNYRAILHFPPSLLKPSSLIYITPKIKVKIIFMKNDFENSLNFRAKKLRKKSGKKSKKISRKKLSNERAFLGYF